MKAVHKYSILIFALSFLSMLIEYIISYFVGVFAGAFVFHIIFIISSFILTMGAGSFCAHYVKKYEHFLPNIILVLSIFSLLIPHIFVFANYYFEINNFLIFSYFIVSFIGFLSGFEFPLIFKIKQNKSFSAKFHVDLAIDYLAMMFASLSFLLFQFIDFDILKLCFIMSIVYFLMSLLADESTTISSKILKTLIAVIFYGFYAFNINSIYFYLDEIIVK